MRPDITAADSYHTPANAPRYLADRLLMNTRLVFLLRYIWLVYISRKSARKGTYNTHSWVDTSHAVFTNVERCGGRINITGMNHVRNCATPAIFVSNHMSTLETMIFPGIIQPLKDIAFVVKNELRSHWAFGDVMRSRNPIFLARDNAREDFRIVLDQGSDLLSKGMSIVMFPQSTRRVEFKASEFNSLGTKLAAKTGFPVIPIAIKTDFWEHGKFTKYLGPINRRNPVHIAFGEPVYVHGTGKEEHQQIISFISTHIESWKEK